MRGTVWAICANNTEQSHKTGTARAPKTWGKLLTSPNVIIRDRGGQFGCTIWSIAYWPWLYCCSVAKSCPTFCNSMGCSPLGFPVLHYIRVCSNLCPLSQWCHKTISSYVDLSPSSLNLSYHQGLFQWVSSLHQVAKVMELQLQHQTYQWIFSVDFLQAWLVLSPCCPRDSEESSFSRKIQFKSISSSALSLFMVQLSYPYMTTGKTVLWLRTIVSKVISLIFNLLFLTAFFFP